MIVLPPRSGPGKHDRDADHLYDAALWQAGYFVTCDRRIARKAGEIVDVITDLWIVTPSELLTIYNAYVAADVEQTSP